MALDYSVTPLTRKLGIKDDARLKLTVRR